MTGIDLTVAIKAGTYAVHELGCAESMNGLICTHTHDVADELQAHTAIEAALRHIREAIAQQINAQERAIEESQMEATGGPLSPLMGGIVAGYAQAASIVRDES